MGKILENVFRYSGLIDGYDLPKVQLLTTAKSNEEARKKMGISFSEFQKGGFETRTTDLIQLAQMNNGKVLCIAPFLMTKYLIKEETQELHQFYSILECKYKEFQTLQ